MTTSEQETNLSRYMAQEDIKDQALAKRVNQIFPNLHISRRTIHNWRIGRSKTVRDWEPFVATLSALYVSEAEADAALREVSLPTIRKLVAMANEESQDYLAFWLEKPDAEEDETSASNPVSSPPPSRLPRYSYLFWGAGGIFLLVAAFFVWQRPFTTLIPTPTQQAQQPVNTASPTLTIVPTVMATAVSPTQPPPDSLPVHYSFESADELNDWQIRGECELEQAVDETAVEGENILVIQSNRGACESIFYDLPTSPIVNETYNIIAWIRTPTQILYPAQLTIWEQTETNINPVSHLFYATTNWQCYQLHHTVTDATTNNLRMELYLPSAGIEAAYLLDDLRISLADSPDANCPPQPPPTIYDSFEQNTDTTPWIGLNQCVYNTELVGGQAQEGEHVLKLYKPSGTVCDGLARGINGHVLPGENYRLRAWIRQPEGKGGSGSLVLRGLPQIISDLAFELEQTDAWHCVETEIQFPLEADTEIAAEIRFHTPHDMPYEIDNVLFMKTNEPLCPVPELAIDAQIRSLPPYYPNAAISVSAIVSNQSANVSGNSIIQGWVAEDAEGFPLDSGALAEREFPLLTPNGQTDLLNLEIYVPINQPPGTYFLVLQTRPNTHVPQENESRTTLSIPITIESCIVGTRFCDVASDHWAFEAIETWYRLGMTKGCRTGTNEYENRPFCPDVVLDRVHFLIFFLRHLAGSDFVPPSHDEVPFAGYYVDVSQDHPWVKWIEAAYRLGITFPHRDCLSTDDLPRFCPEAPLTRAQFAQLLAHELAWELSPVSETPFADVPSNHPAAPAILYMWENGFIPEYEPDCVSENGGRLFCPDELLLRANAAVMMGRIYDLSNVEVP